MPTHRVFFALSLVTIAACSTTVDGTAPAQLSESPACAPTASPSPLPSADVSASNLAGDWFSSDRELPAGPVGSCLANAAYVLHLAQSGDQVTGSVSLVGYPQGGGLFTFPETLTGTDSVGEVHLSGEEKHADGSTVATHYELRFDAQTQHLVGTRNGRPLWLVPLVPQACPLPRPECGQPIS